jgi:hypothetical protein
MRAFHGMCCWPWDDGPWCTSSLRSISTPDNFPEEIFPVNYVAERWVLKMFSEEPTARLSIGERVTRHKTDLGGALERGEPYEGTDHTLSGREHHL